MGKYTTVCIRQGLTGFLNTKLSNPIILVSVATIPRNAVGRLGCWNLKNSSARLVKFHQFTAKL